MLSIALIYGAIAGVVTITAIIFSLAIGDSQHLAGAEFLGYLIMVLALTMVFFGVKRYRDRERGGVIRFLPALGVGLLIASIAGIIYVVVWEFYLAATGYAFITDYTEAILADLAASGASEAELSAQRTEFEGFADQYANPVFRLAVTFVEIFPVGALIALVSALLLRNPHFAPART